MTETQLREKIVDCAKKYLGCKESDGSHRPIIDVYNSIRPLPRGYRMSYDDPWCAAFVSAVGKESGLSAAVLPECACDAMIALYKAAGRWEEQDFAVPHPADLIMYDWDDGGSGDCTGSADHVGIITAINGNILKVIEGNVSDSVGYRSVYLDSRYIRGYCQPDYGALADEEPQAAAQPTGRDDAVVVQPAKTDAVCTLSLPQLSRGMSGEAVRAAQLLLIGRGSRCGPYGADGDFGDGTYGGVYSFQRSRQLECDGIIGPATWRMLLLLE